MFFHLKKDECKFPEDFIAIYFEQVFEYSTRNNLHNLIYLKISRRFQFITNLKKKSRIFLRNPSSMSIFWKMIRQFSWISIKTGFWLSKMSRFLLHSRNYSISNKLILWTNSKSSIFWYISGISSLETVLWRWNFWKICVFAKIWKI